MKKAFFLIVASAFSFLSQAQNNFLLYSFKGNVTIVENNVESKAKVGRALDNGATVKIPAGGVATLICNEAAMFTLTKAGNYALNKFGDSCKISNNSVTANYVKYVWASMTKSSGSPGSNRKDYMRNVGAVTRGGLNAIWIDPKLDTFNFNGVGPEFPLSWKSYADAKEFEFYLYSKDNITEPIFKTTVSKLKVPISMFIKKIQPGNSYYWTAAVKGEENDNLVLLNYMTKEASDAVINKVKAQGGSFEGPAEEAYRMAFMLEDAHYLGEALKYYTKAATLDSTNVLYRSTLMSFKKDYEIK